MRVFVDTSAWFAFANAADPEHAAVRRAFADHRGRLITSNYVFDEILTLCRVRVGHHAAVRVGQILMDVRVVEMIRVTSDDEHEAWALFQARADQEYSFTDCSSFVLMRRLGLTTALAVDADFRREGFATLP